MFELTHTNHDRSFVEDDKVFIEILRDYRFVSIDSVRFVSIDLYFNTENDKENKIVSTRSNLDYLATFSTTICPEPYNNTTDPASALYNVDAVFGCMEFNMGYLSWHLIDAQLV